MAALLHDSSLSQIAPEADKFLAQRDLHPSTPARACSVLQSLAEAEQADRAGTGTAVLAKLKSILHEEPASPYARHRGSRQIG